MNRARQNTIVSPSRDARSSRGSSLATTASSSRIIRSPSRLFIASKELANGKRIPKRTVQESTTQLRDTMSSKASSSPLTAAPASDIARSPKLSKSPVEIQELYSARLGHKRATTERLAAPRSGVQSAQPAPATSNSRKLLIRTSKSAILPLLEGRDLPHNGITPTSPAVAVVS